MRKLAAILSADVAGYSRLMAADEEGTLQRLQRLLSDVLDPIIASHHGHVVKRMGDGLLAEFGSVVDALQGAAAIQRAMAASEASSPPDKRISFRIGVNLGDVIAEGGDLYGDGVNLAARLQELAEPGDVVASGAAVEQAKNKVDLGFQDLGRVELKNLPEPVPAFRLLLAPEHRGKVFEIALVHRVRRLFTRPIITLGASIAVLAIAAAVLLSIRPWAGAANDQAHVEHMALPLPAEPSIAVLPFDNMSGDPAQDYFADGMTETIIGHLARLPRLFVIARNSTFTYKGKPVKVQQVAEELGVRYVLEGSVQRLDDRIRVTAQLIDALSGVHLWAERYDRDAKDLFALQDEITRRVSLALAINLTEGDQARIWRHQAGNSLEVLELDYQAMQYNRQVTREGTAKAKELRERAIAKAGEQPSLLVGLAWVYMREARFGWSADPKASLARAIELTEKAAVSDGNNPEVYLLRGEIAIVMGKHADAIKNAQRAIELAPSMADAHANLAQWLNLSGRHAEAIPTMQKAMRLSPFYPDWYLFELGVEYQLSNKLEDAKATYLAVSKRAPEWGGGLTFLALAQIESLLGQQAAAREAIKTFLGYQPGFTIAAYKMLTAGFAQGVCCEQYLSLLRDLGLPEA